MTQVKIRKHLYEGEEEEAPFAYHGGWPYLNIGFGDEKDYFVENMSLLIAAGLGVTASLTAIRPALKKRRMIQVVDTLLDMVNSGSPLWKAFEQTNFFPKRVISVIKSGEESGRLPEHLNLVSIQQHKEQIFASRLKSALLYPSIIFLTALVVGIGSAWYTLPKLTSVLKESGAQLPVTTRILILLGDFFKYQGIWAVPLGLLSIFIVVYFAFIFEKTKIVGESVILVLPGINKLIQGVEVARFGFLFGAMLQAGIPVTQALDSIREGTNFVTYKKFYLFMRESVLAGNSFETTFKKYPHSDKLIPLPMQQLIFAGEKSGKLAEILLKIGQIFEEKTESMTKDLATILEPIVLLIVGILVGGLALAIISPIYSLVNQAN